ncbi:MAG: hypothetical protein J6W13_08205 [Salinivirgaceae bacterium]|nr:hypothetical protein [Salinivirgaceae bacterium]
MAYHFPFGQEVRPVVQQDRTPKKVFVLGVYASAVHARWKNKDGKVICPSLAVASEPRIFWDGNEEDARKIISKINIPEGAGTLEPAADNLNGPSAKALDEHILKPLGYTREEAWLCDLLPESRLNPGQVKVIEDKYNPLVKQYGLPPVPIEELKRPKKFCDEKRCEEILEELKESQAELLVLLGDEPINQFLRKVTNVDFKKLQDYDDKYKYGNRVEVDIDNRTIEVLPLTHPRNIAKLGHYVKKWYDAHQNGKNLFGKISK